MGGEGCGVDREEEGVKRGVVGGGKCDMSKVEAHHSSVVD